MESIGTRCPKCSETKLLRAKKESSESTNVFRYPVADAGPQSTEPASDTDGPSNRDADPPYDDTDPFDPFRMDYD